MKYFVPFIACLLLVAGIFSHQALAEAIVLTLLWLFVCLIALYEPKVKPLRPKYRKFYTGRALS
jgi:hypothetical protein